jgi:glycosyltransferase involved in cell wall biosynthesis
MIRQAQGVRQLRMEVNGGPARARNLGLSEAKSEWVGFLDADDLWPEGKLRRARAVLETQPRPPGSSETTHLSPRTVAIEYIPVSRDLLRELGELRRSYSVHQH